MMLEEGLTAIDETERLRLQAKVDELRAEERRRSARHHLPGHDRTNRHVSGRTAGASSRA